MAVYVDDFNCGYGRMKMSHMIADTKEELLAMAYKIGIKRKWIQHENTFQEHFDICLSKKEMAIEYGAILVTRRELSQKTIDKRMQELKQLELTKTTHDANLLL